MVVQTTSLYDLPGILTPFDVEMCFESGSDREYDSWGTVSPHEHEFENRVLRICGRKCMCQYAAVNSLGLPQHIPQATVSHPLCRIRCYPEVLRTCLEICQVHLCGVCGVYVILYTLK